MENKIDVSRIEKMVKKEHKEAVQWCGQEYGRTYKMMIDTSDVTIWADVFMSDEEWKNYHSNTIHPLESVESVSDKERPYGTGRSAKSIEEGYVRGAIKTLESAGWSIAQREVKAKQQNKETHKKRKNTRSGR